MRSAASARTRLLPLLLALLLGVTGCSGSGAPGSGDGSPAEVLAEARKALAGTSGVRVSLATEELPEGVPGIVSAKGVGTQSPAPAFKGEITVSLAGQLVTVPVVALDGKVHARLPFTQGFSVVDPAEYGAPDPAALLSEKSGVAALLTTTRNLEQGESVRGGTDNTEVLTEYTGTLPADAVQRIIPSASGGTFEVVWQVTGDARLRRATLTGTFYPGAGPMTYTVDLTDYGLDPRITAP